MRSRGAQRGSKRSRSAIKSDPEKMTAVQKREEGRENKSPTKSTRTPARPSWEVSFPAANLEIAF